VLQGAGLERLPRQPLARADGSGPGIRRQGVACHALEDPMPLCHVHGAHLRVQPRGKELHHGGGQLVHALLPLQPQPQPDEAALDPVLHLARTVLGVGHRGRGADQEQQHGRAAPGDIGRQAEGVLPRAAPVGQVLALGVLHLAHDAAHAAHEGLPLAAQHGQRLVPSPFALQRDHAVQFGHLLRGQPLQLVQALPLHRGTAHQAAQLAQLHRYRRLRLPVQIQLLVFTGEQVAALARLRILQMRPHQLHLQEPIHCGIHAVHQRGALVAGAVGQHGDQHGGGSGQCEAQQLARGHAGQRARARSVWCGGSHSLPKVNDAAR
jgi:hypothetical protein